MNKNNKITISSSGEREYMGYNLFDHVENPAIQTWNRCMLFLNIMGEKRENAANYLKALDREGRLAVEAMIKAMQKDGYNATRAKVRASYDS